MNLDFKKDQPEEYYRKLLLLDKVSSILDWDMKSYVFNKGYCWDLLFKDKDVSILCFLYAYDILKAPFPAGEKYIAENGWFSYQYARDILKDRFILGEEKILDSHLSTRYINLIHIWKENK